MYAGLDILLRIGYNLDNLLQLNWEVLMFGNSLFKTGHVESCPSPEAGCIPACEKRLYTVSAWLAFTAGVLQAAISLLSGSMFSLTDSFHAISDAFADFYGVYVVGRIERNPEREAAIRRMGKWIFALLLVLASGMVAYELLDRIYNPSEVFALGILIAGAAAASAHSVRVRVLSRAQASAPNETRFALLAHASSDLVHSVIVIAVGILFVVVEHVGINIDVRIGGFEANLTTAVDLALSAALVVYMLFLAGIIILRKGNGHHHHHHHGDHSGHTHG